MNTINKADIISWLRKKTTTNVLLVLMITSDGMSSDVFRRTPAGDFTPVEGGAAHEKTSALKTVFEIVSARFQGNADVSLRLEDSLKDNSGVLHQAYMTFKQTGGKIDQKVRLGDDIEVSAGEIDNAYKAGAADIFAKFVKQRMEFCDRSSLRDEIGFGILLTGQYAGMPPVEYAVREAFTISPFMPSPVIDMFGGVESDIRDREELRGKMSGARRLAVNSRGIYFISEDGTVKSVCFGSKKMPAEGLSVTAGEHHVIFLKRDGSCIAIGDNKMGECSLDGITDAVSAYASGDATYLVHKDGSVSAHGTTPLGSEVSKWKNIKALAGNRGFVVGLGSDGSVKCAKERWLSNCFNDVKNWTGVTDIAAAGGCIAALSSDGTVKCSCMDSADKRNAAILFRDIAGIAADSRYIYGLTRDGKVLLAGGGSDLTDMGRSEVSRWKGVLTIAAGNACVAGILEDGTVLSAGNITLPRGWNGVFKNEIIGAADHGSPSISIR